MALELSQIYKLQYFGGGGVALPPRSPPGLQLGHSLQRSICQSGQVLLADGIALITHKSFQKELLNYWKLLLVGRAWRAEPADGFEAPKPASPSRCLEVYVNSSLSMIYLLFHTCSLWRNYGRETIRSFILLIIIEPVVGRSRGQRDSVCAPRRRQADTTLR